MLYRHGDVLVARVGALPLQARPRAGATLARGEFTGHSHRFAEPDAVRLWEANGELFVEVVAERATLVHEEHRPIVLTRGLYRSWMQREYTPTEIRRVID